MSANPAFRLMMCLAACVAAAPAPGAVSAPESTDVYFGSLGAYAVDARDTGKPREEFERARIVEGMDFLAITTPARDSVVPSITGSINARLIDRFVAMYAWRYGALSRGSHVNVLEPMRNTVQDLIAEGHFDLFYRAWLPQQIDTTGNAPIVQFAESQDRALDYGRSALPSLDSFRATTAPYVRTIQIAGRSRGEDTPAAASEMRAHAYLNYLNEGFRIAPTADSEGAWRTAGGEQRTAIVTPRLTKRDILGSIRERRVYATDDGNMKVWYSINQSPMGSVVRVPSGTPLRIQVTIADADEPDASYWISLRRDTPGGELEATHEFSGTDFKGNGTVVFTQFRHSAGEEYFLAHIVQRSASVDHVWTAPIWLVPSEETSPSGSH